MVKIEPTDLGIGKTLMTYFILQEDCVMLLRTVSNRSGGAGADQPFSYPYFYNKGEVEDAQTKEDTTQLLVPKRHGETLSGS